MLAFLNGPLEYDGSDLSWYPREAQETVSQGTLGDLHAHGQIDGPCGMSQVRACTIGITH